MNTKNIVMGKTHLYLVHGYTASSASNWYPSFKKQMHSKDMEVIVLNMPNSNEPKFNEWMNHLEESINVHDEDTIFIGHSLGCIAILNYLNKNRISRSIKGLFLISGFLENTPIPELSEFIKYDLDYSYLIGLTHNSVVVSAKDDDIVPFHYSKEMAEKLSARLILLDNGKHFIDRDNYIDFPVLVNEVNYLVNKQQ